MTSRSFRLETRSRARDEIKRIMQTVEKVRKWEKKWIDLGLSNSLKVYKWVPVRDDNKDDDSDDDNKENEPVELTEAQVEQNGSGEPDLPDIKLHTVEKQMNVDSSTVLASQAPPEMLLGSEDGDKKTSSDQTLPEETPVDPAVAVAQSDGTEEKGDIIESVAKEEESVKEEKLCIETPPTATGSTGEASKEEDVESERMEMEEAGDGGKKTGEGSLPLQQEEPASTELPSVTVEPDANGNTGSQMSEVEREEQLLNQPVKDDQSVSKEEVKCQSPPSEDTTVTSDGGPAQRESLESKKEVEEVDEGEANKTAVVESQEDDHEKRGEKRSRETSLEKHSSTSPPSPKRSRSTSPH